MTTRTFPCLVALTIAVLCTSAAQAVEHFSFNTISDGAGFNGAIDAPSDSGNYTFTTAFPSILQENATSIFMFESGGTGGARSAVLNVLDTADAIQNFTVNSVDWRAFDGLTSGATLTGLSGGSGGTQQWQISGQFDIDPPVTQNNPTTGSFGSEIDTIVWDIPNYADNTFGNTIDNLDINVGTAPPVGNFTKFDFESNASSLFFNGTTTQTIGDHTLTIDVGNLCDREPGSTECGSGGPNSNTFSFAQTDLNVGDPINLSMTIRDVNDTIVPFNLQSIDFAQTVGVSTTLVGVESATNKFDVSVPSTLTNNDFGDSVTQTLDENGNPLANQLVSNIQIFFTNDTGGYKFPAIDNIVVDLGIVGPDELLGDYDDSGQVGQGDLDIVLLNWGGSNFTGNPANIPPGGGSFDGLVGQNELDGVLLNWGNTAVSAVTSVPEPTAFLLLSLGLAMAPRRSRNRK